MTPVRSEFRSTIARDLTGGLVVFLVALPLCLGVALASGAPLLSGLIAGIIGGIVVGILSGSHTSVSGPSPGLTAVVIAQIAALGSFEAFLLALVLAGVLQIVLGIVRAGVLAAFVPSSVIKGLLAAIGILLILKQVPHVLGHDPDPEGEMAFVQDDHQNTFSELVDIVRNIEPGAAIIGLASIAALVAWNRWKPLKNSPIPAPLAIVVLGIALGLIFRQLGAPLRVGPDHMVQVPIAESVGRLFKLLQSPDFALWSSPGIYGAAFTIAAVTCLETLLNLEAVDKIDPRQRTSPPSRELVAQGIGNIASGLLGGLPITSAIVRSSVNVNAGSRTKFATVVHGTLLLVSIILLPAWLNMIPLSCLAAILFMTGIKLASPALMKQMWREGRYQFIPFALTVAAIVLTDLLIGVLLGLAVSAGFILWNNARRPIRRIVEKHLGGDVVRIELANQVSFLNRAELDRILNELPNGGHVLLDATNTDFIDPDILDLIRDFKNQKALARDVKVSLLGFHEKYELVDQIQYMDYSTRELQNALTPLQVLQILKEGNERFRSGRRLTRDLGRQVTSTASGQHPLAVVLSCIDSRTPIELIFDVGVGEVMSIRLAGNVLGEKALGSLEYCCAVAGTKLLLVMGHTRCGAVSAAVNLVNSSEPAAQATGCQHIDPIIQEIQQAIEPAERSGIGELSAADREAFVNEVARRHVERVIATILRQSDTLIALARDGRIAVVGAMYNVVTGDIEFLPTT